MKKYSILLIILFLLFGCRDKRSYLSDITFSATVYSYTNVSNNKTNLFFYSDSNTQDSYLRLLLNLEELPENIKVKQSSDGKKLAICSTKEANDICFKYFLLGDKNTIPNSATILKSNFNQVIYSIDSYDDVVMDDTISYFYNLSYKNLISIVFTLVEQAVNPLYLNNDQKYVLSLNNKFRIVMDASFPLDSIVFRINTNEDIIYINYENVYSNTFITLVKFSYNDNEKNVIIDYPENQDSFIYKEDLDKYYNITSYLETVYVELLDT